jgi:hypothetical protein
VDNGHSDGILWFLLFIDEQGRPIAVIEVEKRALNVGGRPD